MAGDRREAHGDRPRTEQRLDRGKDPGGAHQVDLEHAPPRRHRARHPGSVHERPELSNVGRERIDLIGHGDVATDGLDIAAELGRDLLHALDVAISDDEPSARCELTGDGRAHARCGTDYDIGHQNPFDPFSSLC